MIKKAACILLVFVLVFANILIVNAATPATAVLAPSKTTVNPGEEFTVNLTIDCADGINGTTGISFSFNSELLEFVSFKVIGSDLSNMGTPSNVELMANTSGIKTAKCEFKFKAKQGITSATSAALKLNEFEVDRNIASDSYSKVAEQTVNINISAGQPNTEPTTQPTVVPTNQENNTPEQGNENGKSDEEKIANEEKQQVASVTTPTPTAVTSNDAATAKKVLPKAGLVSGVFGAVVVIAVVVIAVVGCVFYIKQRNICK